MRAILIDPWARAVRELDLTGDTLPAIYSLMSGKTVPLPGEDGEPPETHVRTVTVQSLGRSPIGGELVDLWIDEDGMLASRQAYFTMGGGTFAGKAVILGSDKQGRTIGTTLTMPLVWAKLGWIPLGVHIEPPDPIVIGYSDDVVLRAMGIRS